MRRLWVLIPFIAYRIFLRLQHPHCSEDAYITFHAVSNAAWLPAVTSPVWLWILKLPVDPVVFSSWLALVLDVVAVLSARTLTGASLVALLWSLPLPAGSSLSGLETHVAACALMAAWRWPQFHALASALRPDTALLSLAASWVGHRSIRWPLVGLAVMVVVNFLTIGAAMPHTVSAKLSAYGPKGVLCFWWYMVAPLGLAVSWAAYQKWLRPVHLVPALALFAFFHWREMPKMQDRLMQGGVLYSLGEEWAKLNPSGLTVIEPAGMIPYLNPGLIVADEVGLISDDFRNKRDGYLYEFIRNKNPQWVVVRFRDILSLQSGGVATSGIRQFRSVYEFQWFMENYELVVSSGSRNINGKLTFINRSSSMMVFRSVG